jgi:hypothetical protein
VAWRSLCNETLKQNIFINIISMFYLDMA